MPNAVDEEVVQVKTKEEDGKHCRCKKFVEEDQGDAGGVEKPSVIKDSYFSKVASQYKQSKDNAGPPGKMGFTQLRQECLKRQVLFVDDDFPPTNYSITFNGCTQRNYEWKRPREICSDPHLFVEGATRFDIQQGEIGDCWLLAAVSTLTLNPRIFNVVVPRDQSMNQMYCGIFHFRFWQYGRWEDVYVDDLLPTYMGRLVFMHSKTPNEFWCALLEKAYAKLYGCYEALKGGNINESMVDLTGGVVEMVDLHNPPPNLFTVMRKAYHRSALMGCAIEPQHPGVATEHRLPNGLIQRHAYSVTRVTKADIPWLKTKQIPDPCSTGPPPPNISSSPRSIVSQLVEAGSSLLSSVMPSAHYTPTPPGSLLVSNGETTAQGKLLATATETLTNPLTPGVAHVELIRLHNPWGNEAEWKGAWSDQSQEWAMVSPQEKERLGITFDDDGEFWMPFADFVKNFTTLEICDTTPESFSGGEDEDDDRLLSEEEVLRRWRMAMFEGAWITNKTAGGCRNFIDTFATNPQFTVLLEDPDVEDDQCTLVVSLMQKNIRQMKRFGAEYLPIGFAIYKLPQDKAPGQHLDTEFFRYTASTAKVPHFLNIREVTCRFRFPPGIYVIIPSTFDPFRDAEFLLRVYTEAPKNTVIR